MDSPTGLVASYTVTPVPSEAFVGGVIEVSVKAANSGRAVWLSSSPDDLGEVRLGWRWFRDGVEVAGGRVFLSSDVSPGQVARFAARILPPPVPGEYVLTIDLVSEGVTWFADQGGRPLTFAVRVRPVELDHFLAQPGVAMGRVPTVTISTDQASYHRGETLRLTVEARDPHYPPNKVDVYLLRQGPDGVVWFYDGRRRFVPDDNAWVPLVRDRPMPGLAIGRFALPLSSAAPGAHRAHVVVTAAGTYRPLAKATAAFRVEP